MITLLIAAVAVYLAIGVGVYLWALYHEGLALLRVSELLAIVVAWPLVVVVARFGRELGD